MNSLVGYLALGTYSTSNVFTELTGTGYARTAITLTAAGGDSTDLTATTSGGFSNTGSTSWSSVTHGAIFDATGGGNLLLVFQLVAAGAVGPGTGFGYQIGGLSFSSAMLVAAMTNASQITLFAANAQVGTVSSAASLPVIAGGPLAVSSASFGIFSGLANGSVTPVTTIAASGASQALAFSNTGSVAYDITLTANCALTLTGGVAGQLQTVVVILRQNASAGWTPTLPAGVKWTGGAAPIANTTAGVVDVYTFRTSDAGATILGSY